MMKSLSRLFGGKKSADPAPANPAADASASPPTAHAAPTTPKPNRPVEVLTADDQARTATTPIEADGEAPLSTEPLRHNAAARPGTPIGLSGPDGSNGPVGTDEHPIVIDRQPAADAPATPDDTDDDDDRDDVTVSLSTRRGKQEMLNQLRRNYDEVLGIVRKVDQHLDDQARRSERMLEIAERTAKNLEHLQHLGPMNERQAEMAETLTRLVEITKTSQDDAAATGAELMRAASEQLEQQREQTGALRDVKSSIELAGEHDREMADSIKGFTDTIGGVKTATNELGHTITAMRENDADRERELAQIVARSQRWLIVTVVVVGVVAVGALAAVVMAAL